VSDSYLLLVNKRRAIWAGIAAKSAAIPALSVFLYKSIGYKNHVRAKHKGWYYYLIVLHRIIIYLS
jgi:hypothetical protein